MSQDLEVGSQSKFRAIRRYMPRVAEILVAVVFLVGALLKAWDVNGFTVGIWAYGVVHDKSWLPPIALFTLCLETFLGWALLCSLRMRMIAYLLLEGMLVFFTGLILYGWAVHGIQDCGCMGPLKMSPGVSIAKNLVLIALGGFGAWGAWRHAAPVSRYWPKAIGAALLCGAVCGYAYAHLDRMSPTNASGGEAPRPFAQFAFDLPEGHFDLGKGEYLVAMLSMDCDHCREEAPLLNKLMREHPELPPLVALCLEESPGDMDEFRGAAHPEFPMYSLGNHSLLYFSLIGKETFRLYVVRDGRAIAFWDKDIPDYDTLMAAVAVSHAAPAMR